MSLYWHVASTEEVLGLRREALAGEVGVPELPGDWQAVLSDRARRHRAVLLRHQWAMEFMGARPPAGPNDVRILERALSMIDGLGLHTRTSVDILMTVVT